MQAQQQAQQQALQEQRAYQEGIRQEELLLQQGQQADEQARLDFNNTIMANYNNLQGLANQLQAQGAPQWQVDAVLAARQQKIMEQGLDQQGNPLPQAPDMASILDLAQWKVSNNIPLNEQEASILGVRPGYTKPITTGRASGGGGTTVTTPTGPSPLPIKTITSAIDNAIGGIENPRITELTSRLDQIDPTQAEGLIERQSIIDQINLLRNQDPNQQQIKQRVLNTMVQNPDWFDQDSLRQTLALYNITPQELADYEAFREAALNDRPFE
jgi:hypothetical protein